MRKKFVLKDLEHPRGRAEGWVWEENGQLMISLKGYGNGAGAGTLDPIVVIHRDCGVDRVLLFRDYSNEAPTETLDLTGAKTPPAVPTTGS